MDVFVDLKATDARFGLYAAAGYELTAGGLSVSMSAEQFQQLCDNLRPWIVDEAQATDARRYQQIRKGQSDLHGDVYAMVFAGDGDYPVRGDNLDTLADGMIAREGKPAADILRAVGEGEG